MMDGSNIGAFVTEMKESNVVLVVVDTLARHILGHENDTKDMSQFVSNVDELKARLGATALIIHHTGHDPSRGRGNSAYKAALDIEIMCDKGRLSFSKMKDSEAPPPIEFKLLPISIGTDEAGEPITSCVIDYGARSVKNREQKLTELEQLLAGLVKKCPGLHMLRKEFYDARRNENSKVKNDALKKAFKRSLEGLVAKEIINLNGNSITLRTGTILGHLGTCPAEDTQGHGDIIFKEMSSVPSFVPPTDSSFGLAHFLREAYT